jgi:hypothetical protein
MVSRSTPRGGRGVAEGSAQYRRRHAEPESSLASLCLDSYDFVMVVPAYAESPVFVDGYRAAARHAGRLLVIVVLNGRIGAGAAVHASNADCFRGLRDQFAQQGVGRGAWLGHDDGVSVLVIDRFTGDHRLPARQGVGLARKIGADVALELIARGQVGHPFIAMTDADARLPDDYFDRIADLEPECSAGLFPFWHEPGGHRAMDRATALYEIRLRYFHRGLQWAHSPYAFHTVGSTMVVHALCYALVRGVPRRRAGEDFYLLGKLSKLRPLAYVRGAPIRLLSRLSERVPFGTGSESAKLERGAECELYHPDCFASVRDVTLGLQRCCRDSSGTARGAPESAVAEMLSQLSSPVKRFLEAQGAPEAWRRISAQAPNPMARLRHLHDWFDGFRTLKLIHHIRDYVSPVLPWQEAVRCAPFMDAVDDDGACLITARTELLRVEQCLPRLVGPSAYLCRDS